MAKRTAAKSSGNENNGAPPTWPNAPCQGKKDFCARLDCKSAELTDGCTSASEVRRNERMEDEEAGPADLEHF
jgi:hypothetical protein